MSWYTLYYNLEQGSSSFLDRPTQFSESTFQTAITSSPQPSTPVSSSKRYTELQQTSFTEEKKIKKSASKFQSSQIKTVNELISELYELQEKKLKKESTRKTSERKIMEQVI